MVEESMLRKILWHPGRIFVAAVVAALLDAVAAILFLNADPAGLFRFIASGFFGKAAFTGGSTMVYWGVFFHFFVALCWTVALFALYPAGKKMLRSWVVFAVLSGIVIWLVMNIVVLPLTNAPVLNHSWSSVVKGILILIGAVGFPVTWIIRNSDNLVIRQPK